VGWVSEPVAHFPNQAGQIASVRRDESVRIVRFVQLQRRSVAGQFQLSPVTTAAIVGIGYLHS
jgi:hypothetical protein